jgi:hypothetical protein
VYAQVFELSRAGWTERLDRSINCELLPALRSAEGFCGALNLVRRESREMLLVVFWETESEAVGPLHPSLAALFDEFGAAGLANRMPEIWEVSARA